MRRKPRRLYPGPQHETHVGEDSSHRGLDGGARSGWSWNRERGLSVDLRLAIGAVPSRKSKSQPRFACVTWRAYSGRSRAGRRPRAASSAARRAPAPRRSRAASSRRAGDVELDEVAVAHERERAADERLRRDVQHARAVARAAHARVGDAHHVAHALLQQLLRDRQHAPFGHARARRAGRRSAAPAPSRRVTGERGIVDARVEVVVVAEHDRRPGVLAAGAARRPSCLITAPSGARLPRSTATPPSRPSGRSTRRG